MVKKQLVNGEFCEKCRQIEELLKKRGHWDRIDDVVIAEEDNPGSPGMILSAEHGIELAPFFIVETDDGDERVYTRALEMIRKEFGQLRPEGSDEDPAEIVRTALTDFGSRSVLAFSGAEDVVLIDMAVKTGLPFSVFSLDTGRLHPQTYRFIDQVRNHYGIDIQVMTPDQTLLEPFVQEKGLFSFYNDGHKECCGIRKVEPLRRLLNGFSAWITGQRKDQNPSTRGEVPIMEEDSAFKGAAGKSLIKFNPLAEWSLSNVWEYIRVNDVPYNELHDRGFISIGCEPCTRAIRPGEHERAGRWWWEEETKRECGLHVKE